MPLFPGVSGALACCRELLDAAGVVRLVMPPRPVKDFRDWVRGGVSEYDVGLAIGRAKPLTPTRWCRRARACTRWNWARWRNSRIG